MRGGEPMDPPAFATEGIPTRPAPVLPQHARRGVFHPVAGTALSPRFMVVSLPGEQIRSEIVKVYGPDVVTVKLGLVLLGGRTHQFRAGDMVAVQRVETEFSEEWKPVSETETREAEEHERAMRAARRLEEMDAEADPAESAEFPPKPELSDEVSEVSEVTKETKVETLTTSPDPDPAPARRVLGPRRNKIRKAG